jgi:hypothetical protein
MKEMRYPRLSRLQSLWQFPPDLHRALPQWWRNARLLSDIAFPVMAIVLLGNGQLLYCSLALLAGICIDTCFGWFAIGWLKRRKLWQHGAWYATWLPAMLKLRTGFLGCLVAAGVGAYLILGMKVFSAHLIIATIGVLALIPMFYVWISLKLGFIGNAADINFREDEPVRFWMGLVTYTFVIIVLLSIVIFILWDRYVTVTTSLN